MKRGVTMSQMLLMLAATLLVSCSQSEDPEELAYLEEETKFVPMGARRAR